MSERPTDDTGFGSWESWPTAQASDANGGKGIRLDASVTGRLLNGSKASISLRDRILRTAASSPVDAGDVLENWQTPNAMDGGSTSRSGNRKNELLLGGQVRHANQISNRHPRLGLHSRPDNLPPAIGPNATTQPGAEKPAHRRWPTPTSADGTSGPGHAASSTGAPNLRTVATGLPDPVNLSTNGNPPDSWPTPNTNQNHNSGRLDEWGGKGNKFRGTALGRGQLNARWVLTLQGAPADWCDLDAGTIKSLYEARVMPTRPKSPS